MSHSFVGPDGSLRDVQVWSDDVAPPVVDLERLVEIVEKESTTGG